MRALVACTACRSRRRKCHTEKGSSTCSYCDMRGFKCHRGITPSKARRHENTGIVVQSHNNETPETGIALPSLELCLELVELYFDLIHDQFHSLFHRPSLIEQVRNGTAPRVLLFAIIALSARFSSNAIFSNIPPRDRCTPYYDESTKLLDLRLNCITTIQACVLLGGISTTEDNAITESVYYTVACRMATLLDIARRPVQDPLEREVNIRVWWTLCMVDVWSSRSVRLPRQMPHTEDLPLPIDEMGFLQWRPGDIPPDHGEDSSSSLLAQMITLNRILSQINDAMSDTAAGSTIPLLVEQTVRDLSQKMDDWYAALPSYMHDTPANLQRYASQGLGRIFVAVYLGYYHFGQLLFYPLLHEGRHGSENHYYANKCKAFAAKLCTIVYASHATPGCEVWYNMVGHILVIASTIQIHTLLFDTDEVVIAAARSRLERNFTILMRLREYWPMLESCFARLQIFHEVCRQNSDSSFRMDTWMLKFLSEFAEPVRVKEDAEQDGIVGLCSVENVGVSPQDWV
ncbi:fungal-specific transcription factor domain-containing protein [Rhexocercosporidium sp. MPI-PUGE-AT-0058]|nr:fungal-specific transcription factor domain-containing protein [Rhexocercosporidium sp. MPI-PUGE-AT-0058]